MQPAVGQGALDDANFRMQALAMREGVTQHRLQTRRQLLDSFNQDRTPMTNAASTSLREQQSIAFDLLTSGKMVEAFEINRESDVTRERYGRNKFGQSLLLSRRMVQAGVPFVQATMGIVQTWCRHGTRTSTIGASLRTRCSRNSIRAWRL